AHPTIGLRIMEPAGLHELAEGKVDLLIDRSAGRYPSYRCERLESNPGVVDYLIYPEGLAGCAEIECFRAWLNDPDGARHVVRFTRDAARTGLLGYANDSTKNTIAQSKHHAINVIPPLAPRPPPCRLSQILRSRPTTRWCSRR